MADIKVLSIDEIRAFENACVLFDQEIDRIQGRFLSQTGTLSETWKDDRFQDFDALMGDMDRELLNAKAELPALLSYVRAKRQAMQERP